MSEAAWRVLDRALGCRVKWVCDRHDAAIWRAVELERLTYRPWISPGIAKLDAAIARLKELGP